MAAIALDAFDYALLEALPTLRAYAASLTRNRADADDLIQDTVMSALRHRDSFVAGSSMAAWLTVIARNRYRTDMRTAASRGRYVLAGLEDVVAPMAPTQHQRLEAMEALDAAGRLSPKLGQAMAGVIAELTTEEAAAAHQLPPATVRTRRCRAGDAMRAQFGMTKLMAAG